MKIPSPLLEQYLADPVGRDADVREAMRISPEDYYTVSVWPDPGIVAVDRPKKRTVRGAKISKSNQ